jgi:hypothetical protein
MWMIDPRVWKCGNWSEGCASGIEEPDDGAVVGIALEDLVFGDWRSLYLDADAVWASHVCAPFLQAHLAAFGTRVRLPQQVPTA